MNKQRPASLKLLHWDGCACRPLTPHPFLFEQLPDPQCTSVYAAHPACWVGGHCAHTGCMWLTVKLVCHGEDKPLSESPSCSSLLPSQTATPWPVFPGADPLTSDPRLRKNKHIQAKEAASHWGTRDTAWWACSPFRGPSLTGCLPCHRLCRPKGAEQTADTWLSGKPCQRRGRRASEVRVCPRVSSLPCDWSTDGARRERENERERMQYY